MKRKQQLEFEIQRREITLTLRRGTPPAPGDGSTATSAGQPVGLCPACGSGWVLLLDASASIPPVTSESLCTLMASLSLHIHTSAEGDLWICRRSFDELKERSK